MPRTQPAEHGPADPWDWNCHARVHVALVAVGLVWLLLMPSQFDLVPDAVPVALQRGRECRLLDGAEVFGA